MSYSTFEYSNLNVKKENSDHIEIEFTLKNDSKIKGDEVVQLYIIEPSNRTQKPNKSLKAYKIVSLKPNESKQVILKVNVKDLEIWNPIKDRYEIRKGHYIFQIGCSSDNIKLTTEINIKFHLVPKIPKYKIQSEIF